MKRFASLPCAKSAARCSARWTAAAAALLMLAALAPPAAHGAEFQVIGNISYHDPSVRVIDQYDATAPASVGRGVRHDSPAVQNFHAQADSLAENHGLHAHAYTQVIHNVSGSVPPATSGGLYSAFAFARASFGDFVVSGPLGASAVPTALNFHLTGQQILTSFIPPAGHGGGGSTSWAAVTISLTGIGNDGGSYALTYQRGLPQPPNETGMLVGFDGDAVLKTKVFMLPVNTPIAISLFLQVGASVSVDFADAFNVATNTDFGNTLTFATDRPVFDLPAGYTLDSVEAGIANNVFTPAVPEPATAWTAVMGLGGLWLLLRRRLANG